MTRIQEEHAGMAAGSQSGAQAKKLFFGQTTCEEDNAVRPRLRGRSRAQALQRGWCGGVGHPHEAKTETEQNNGNKHQDRFLGQKKPRCLGLPATVRERSRGRRQDLPGSEYRAV